MTEQRDQSNVDFSTALEYRASKPHYTLTMPAEGWYELLFIVAGIGSGAVMHAAPNVVMPSDEISAAIVEFLEGALSIPRPKGHPMPELPDKSNVASGPRRFAYADPPDPDPDFPVVGTTRWELHKALEGPRVCIKRVEVVGIFENRAEARQWMIDHEDERR